MDGGPLTAAQCDAYAQELAGDGFGLAAQLGEAELGRTIAGVRCRVSLFWQQGSWSAAIQTTGGVGNIVMDKALLTLFSTGVISRETYESALRDPALTGRSAQPQIRSAGAAR